MGTNKIIFCTYFDKNYLFKGLALHSSLVRYNPSARLWILCMDSYTEENIRKLKLTGVTVIKIDEFEDKELQRAKKNRGRIEYCWTCTPSLLLYVFKKNQECKTAVYVDADLFFYSSIDPIFTELDDKSIYIVEHRFPSDQLGRIETSGRFNVGILAFRRDKEGLACLVRWRNQCLKWCYWKEQDGKMGDQAYLNEWPKLYKNIAISRNLGVNAAPWNIGDYKVRKKNDGVFINADKLICYHFHQFKIFARDKFSFSDGYKISSTVKEYIYDPYIQEIKNQTEKVLSIDPYFKAFEKRKKLRFSKIIQDLPRILTNKFKSLLSK